MAANLVTDAFRKSQVDASSFALMNFSTFPGYFLLVNGTGDAVADATKRGYTWESDVNGNEVTGVNYVARGQALASLSVVQAVQVVTFTSANPSWSTATITANGGWLLNHQSTTGTSPLIGYYTFGGAVASTAGTFTVQVNANGWIQWSGG